MTAFKHLPAVAAIALLGACEARFGNDAGPVAENASASGRAEEGRLTVEAPGFNMSINIPERIRAHADIDDDNGLVYPGATLAGMHVQGHHDGGDGEGDGEVEMRFTTGDAPDNVVAWYRDPARGGEVRIASAQRQGNGFVITGTGSDGQRFTVTIAPRAGGGSEARLLLVDAH